MRNRLLDLSRRCKQWLVFGLDVMFSVISTHLAFVLRLDSFELPDSPKLFAYIGSLVFIPIFIRFRLYNSIFRYSSLTAVYRVNVAIFIYAIFYFSLIFWIGENEELPKAIGVLQPGIFLLLVILSRTIARLWFYGPRDRNLKSRDKQRLMIYGAGSAGEQILSSLANSREFEVVCFIDDNPALNKKNINGVPIYHSSLLGEKIKELNVSDILLAIPSLEKSKRLGLIANLSKYSIYVRTLPDIAELIRGEITSHDIQDLNLNDLLGREPIFTNCEALAEHIKGKVILITGAGGSIGSEICRQILFLAPHQIILIEHSELALYQITEQLKQQMTTHSPTAILVPVLGDVKNYSLMLQNIKTYQPDVIYHAAAYKHVPLVEENPIQGVANNTLGTLTVAQIAVECGVRNFVLISTDKAVRPTNVMGASKRLSELCLQAFAGESYIHFNSFGPPIKNNTIFTMVRFGNVLGSSGSVVPLFKQQILNGGPITLTDKRVTRYFMSIPEATQLVIQAGIMSKGGEVFVLDMGDSIKIIDLAKKMIQLMGKSLRDEFNPYGDIEIKEIGLRPGEKLYEELLIGDNPVQSNHPKIMVAHEIMVRWSELSTHLSQLRLAIEENNFFQVQSILTLLVTGYLPNQSHRN